VIPLLSQPGNRSGKLQLQTVQIPEIRSVEPKRVNLDFPTWVVTGLDRQAQKLGVTRQAPIKMWIADRLEWGRCDQAQ